MKNVNTHMEKTCIFLTCEELTEILKGLYPDSEINVEPTLDGLIVEINETDINTGGSHSELATKLTEYFDVIQITSIHTDIADVSYYPVGIWICYR